MQLEFEGKIMSEAWSTGFMDAESSSYNPPEGNKDLNIEYKRGREIRLQQLATSVEEERAARLGPSDEERNLRLFQSRYGSAYRQVDVSETKHIVRGDHSLKDMRFDEQRIRDLDLFREDEMRRPTLG